MFAGIGIFVLLFLVISVSLGSCSASIEGAGSVIGITTYPSSDEDIYAAENRYAALESALNQQINEMERRHPNYDEYQYNIAEIGHNPVSYTHLFLLCWNLSTPVRPGRMMKNLKMQWMNCLKNWKQKIRNTLQ